MVEFADHDHIEVIAAQQVVRAAVGDDVEETFRIQEVVAIVSIAVSLKRIADHLSAGNIDPTAKMEVGRG